MDSLPGLSAAQEAHPDRRSAIGLDWLNFFTANLQTAFGPFVSVYLTEQRWTQADIGFALSAGYVATMISQVPAGFLVDRLARKTRAAGAAIVAVIAGALLFATMPRMLPVLLAEISHAFASCMLVPAIAAISLMIAGTASGAAGERLGRNARFASIGNGVAAGLMAVIGTEIGPRAVFLTGAALAIPGLIALGMIRSGRAVQRPVRGGSMAGLGELLLDRRLIWFALCMAAFTMGNAAMLPLAASRATQLLGNTATLVIGACIVGPQIVVAILSPACGRAAERRGRRPVLIAGMMALPMRGLLLATDPHAAFLVPIQLLDGVSGAAFGVLVPLIASDIASRNGRFNLCMGVLGLAMGAAAACSTWVAGALADWSPRIAFLCLAAAGGVGVVLAASMPETKPED
jgi:MFS family permease